MANSSLCIVRVIRGYHIHKDDWNPYRHFTWPLAYLKKEQFNLMMPLGCVTVKFGDPDEIGVCAHNNFSDEYLETFPSKHY